MHSFEKFITEACNFVGSRRGVCTNDETGEFLSDIQKRGISLTDNSKFYGFLLVDYMNALYVSMPPANFTNLIAINFDFVKKQKGVWDHGEWSNLLSDIKARGITLDDDAKDSLGLVLDAIRLLYVEKAKYKELIELAGMFVEQHRGAWGHAEWLSFLSVIEEKGIDLNDYTKHYLGLVLENMKAFYNTSTSAGQENFMLDISKDTTKFMIEKRFIWGDPEWRDFLSRIRQKGIEITTEEAKNSLGSILDSARKLMGY